MSTFVRFYHMNKDPRTIDKIDDITVSSAYEVYATIFQPCDVLFPELRLAEWYEFKQFYTLNYAYISDFNRYYYVTDIIGDNGNCFIIKLKIDVLQTYKDYIKNYSATCIRNGGTSRPTYVTDSSLPLYSANNFNTSIIIDTFDKGTKRDYYVLTTK